MKVDPKQDVKNLKKWLENNLASKMAYLLGYKHSQSVTAWVERGNIPFYIADRVREIIRKDMENEQLTSSTGTNLRSDEGTVRVTG